MSIVDVRVVGPDDWRVWRALRLDALRDAPDAFSTTLAEWQGAGDTEARWKARLGAVPYNVVAFVDGRAAGIASGTAPDDDATTELISMWVAPFARGRGVGDALVEAIVAWARDRAKRVTLNVYERNAYANALYRRHRFVDAGASAAAADGRVERRMVRVLRT